jgi:hypothetical protein
VVYRHGVRDTDAGTVERAAQTPVARISTSDPHDSTPTDPPGGGLITTTPDHDAHQHLKRPNREPCTQHPLLPADLDHLLHAVINDQVPVIPGQS